MADPMTRETFRLRRLRRRSPQTPLTREQVKFYFEKVFGLEERRLQAMMTVIDNGCVERRFCIQPVEYFVEPRPLEQITREYSEHAIKLGEEAATKCLAAAGLEPSDVDLLITTFMHGRDDSVAWTLI